MMREFKVFDAEAVATFECVFKHWCADHELGWEYVTTIIATQLAEEKGNVDDLVAKLNHVSSVTGDVEELLEEFVYQFLVKDVATATNQIRVDKEDIAQFIWQYGHFVTAEEHLADYIKKYVAKLQKAKSEEERDVTKEKILTLSKFLYTARLIRKKYLSGFLQELEKSGEVDEGK